MSDHGDDSRNDGNGEEDGSGRHLRPVHSSLRVQPPRNDRGMVPYDPLQAQAEDEDTIDLREYWRILLKRKWAVVS
ncbi:MAG: hypothetical protein ACPGJE_07240, partial [Wenzhouxiangellaceae bacterium]